MSKLPRMALTRTLKVPTEYATALNGEWSRWAFNEERAVEFKGKWRSEVFGVADDHPLDLEIGTGNGYHFAHLAKSLPGHSILGIELKFKPLIQSIRRACRGGAENARIVRYDAGHLQNLFAEREINDVYIHFPDPWGKKRHWKHRLIQTEFLDLLHHLMRKNSVVDFKTDSADYFAWATERFHASQFEVTRETRDLHGSAWKDQNFVTHFEQIFLSQGLPIHYARLEKR